MLVTVPKPCSSSIIYLLNVYHQKEEEKDHDHVKDFLLHSEQGKTD